MWDTLRCWQQAELPRNSGTLNPDNVLPQGLYTGCTLCLDCAPLRCHMIGSLSLRSLLKCHLLRQRPSLTTLSKVIPPYPAITLFIIFFLCGTTYHQNVSSMKAGFLFCHQHLAHPETPAGTRWVCGPCREPEIPSTSDDPHPISQSSFCSKQLAPFLCSLENLFFNSLFLCCASWPETVRTLCFLSNHRETPCPSLSSRSAQPGTMAAISWPPYSGNCHTRNCRGQSPFQPGKVGTQPQLSGWCRLPACLLSGSDPQYSNNSAFSPLDE